MTTHDNDFQEALSGLENHTAPVQGSLCSACKHLVEASNWFTSDITLDLGTIVHQPNALELKSSADKGCHLCSLFYGSLGLAPSDTLPNTYLIRGGPLEAEVHRCCVDDDKAFSVELFDSSNRQGTSVKLQGQIEREICSDQDRQETPAKYKQSYDSTASNQSTEIAREWLNHCLLHHEVCQERSGSSRTVPTRLLRINETPLSVQLVLNNDPKLDYLILSYCWGKPRADELKLTRENADNLMEALHFADLPKTMQDAIVVTKKLGYRYLWVDRLCIFQGDQHDWEYEVLRMGDYYLNSKCCIAALSSASSHQGLFTARNSLLMQSLILNGPDGKVQIEPQVGGIQGDYPRLFRGPQYALTKRAWTLQERLLSPRTLYYGSLMIYWECRTMCRKESLPTKHLELPFAKELRKFRSCSAGGIEDLWRTPQTQMEMENFEERWANLVQFYTRCGMTNASDRLVAISGMMDSISQRTQLKFVHGLLESQLTTELLWWQWVDCNGDAIKIPERNVGVPTWSWGSVKGRIEPFRCPRWLVPSRLSWTMEAEASKKIEQGQALWGRQTHDRRSKVCRVAFSVPLLEASCLARLDLRHYNWAVQAVGDMGANGCLKLSAQMWADEPMHEGKTVWLLRMARLQDPRSHQWRFAGIAIARIENQAEADGHLWRRVGYWEGGQLAPLQVPTDVEGPSARRALKILEVKFVDLV